MSDRAGDGWAGLWARDAMQDAGATLQGLGAHLDGRLTPRLDFTEGQHGRQVGSCVAARVQGRARSRGKANIEIKEKLSQFVPI